jgi:uncharacterized protein YaaQ
MKLILTIINDNDNEAVSQAHRGRFTGARISSTGGFMRRGSSTFDWRGGCQSG